MVLSRGHKLSVGLVIFAILWIIGFFNTFDPKYQDIQFTIKALPSYFLICFGCYALLEIGKGLFFLDDYPQEYQLLLEDIKTAKAFLSDKKIL